MSQINITLRDFIMMYSDIIGNDPDEQCSIDLINKSRFAAYATGDWVGTIGYERINTGNGRFLLPTEYEAIREAKYVCGGQVTVNVGPMHESDYRSCASPVVITKLDGRTYSPIQLTENCPFLVKACNSRDNEKSFRIIYTDTNGSYRDETILLSEEKPTSLQYVPSVIKRISKDRTVGIVTVQSGQSIGVIKAFETSPVYSIYCISATNCSGLVYYRAKKRCIPYTFDDLDESLDINPEALSSLVMASKFKSDRGPNWYQDYVGATDLATKFLKKEIQNEQDTVIGVKPVYMSEENFFDSLVEN